MYGGSCRLTEQFMFIQCRPTHITGRTYISPTDFCYVHVAYLLHVYAIDILCQLKDSLIFAACLR